MNRERLDAELRVRLENIKLTEAEEEDKQRLRCVLESERTRLQTRITTLMRTFDKQLEQLLVERARVDVDVCLIENQLLLLFREYQMLLVYRQRDAELHQQLQHVKAEQSTLKCVVDDTAKENAAVKCRVSSLHEKLKTHKRKTEEFLHNYAPTEHLLYLQKVFHRYFKRRKRKGSHGSGNSEDDDDITSDDEDELNNEDDDAAELHTGQNKDSNQNDDDEGGDEGAFYDPDFEEVCPVGCPGEL
uniref:Uncharacterized protein n=1 Tax=Lygus hesperus TaxID=30085 RepID=A0A0A9WG78_LYGHE